MKTNLLDLLDKARKENKRIIVHMVLVYFEPHTRVPLILLLKRSAMVSAAGMDDLPGGKVEGDEELLTAIIREVQEETGVILDQPINYLTSYDLENRRCFVFQSIIEHQNIVVDRAEHSSFEFVSIYDIRNAKLRQSIVDIIEHYSDSIIENHRGILR